MAADPEWRRASLLIQFRELRVFPQTGKKNLVISLAGGRGFEQGREGSPFGAAGCIRWNAERILE